MKYLKRAAAVIMALVMIVSCSVTAFAGVDDVYSELQYNEYSTFQPDAIQYMRFVDTLGIVSSYRNGFFNPQDVMTRGEAIQVAYRMLHCNYDELSDYNMSNTGFDFDELNEKGDVKDTDILKLYIAWGEDYGLVNSKYVEKNMFEPTKGITAGEFLTLMIKVLGLANGDALDDTTVTQSLPTGSEESQQGEEGEDPLYSTYEDVVNTITTGTEVSIEDTTITREQAAIIVANAMVFDPNYDSYSEETFKLFRNDNGDRLNCLATNVYGCNYADGLFIAATKQMPLDYDDVTHDVLLSNGAQVDLGEDLSDYLGYPIQIVYQDFDESDTFTEDENVLSFAIESISSRVVSLSDLVFTDYSTISSTSGFAITASTMLYLNGERWPISEAYKLFNFVNGIDFATALKIQNRPNLKFAIVQAGNEDNVGRAFATEWIPGRIMTVTKNYVSFYSYYDNQIRAYKDRDVYYQSMVNPKSGDFINFYESNGKLHVKAGTTMEVTGFSSANGEISGTQNGFKKTFTKHQMASPISQTLSDPNSKVTVVLDETGSTYIAYEETRATQEVGVKITSVSAASGSATIQATELDSGEAITLNVPIENITATTGQMNVGDIFTYYKTESGAVYMFSVDEIQTDVIETADYFLIENEQKLLKADGFVSDSDQLHTGTVTLLVDRFNGVWAVQ